MGVGMWDEQEWYDGKVDQRMFYFVASLVYGRTVQEGLHAGSG